MMCEVNCQFGVMWCLIVVVLVNGVICVNVEGIVELVFCDEVEL